MGPRLAHRSPRECRRALHRCANVRVALAQFAQDGAYAVGNTPQAFAQEVRDEIAKWAKVIRDANIKL